MISIISGKLKGQKLNSIKVDFVRPTQAKVRKSIMDTIYDSGFNRGDMYITDHPQQSHPEFKEFSRTEKSLNRIKLD